MKHQVHTIPVDLTLIASNKLVSTIGDGFKICGIAVYNEEKDQYGIITEYGRVVWTSSKADKVQQVVKSQENPNEAY